MLTAAALALTSAAGVAEAFTATAATGPQQRPSAAFNLNGRHGVSSPRGGNSPFRLAVLPTPSSSSSSSDSESSSELSTSTSLNVFGRGPNNSGGGGAAVTAANGTDTAGGLARRMPLGDGDEPLVDANPTFITPEGYGFTTPMSRILRQSGRGIGYYKAKASDSVIEVMQALTTGDSEDGSSRPVYDVALVCSDDDENKVVGLFTETDYIKVRALYLFLL